MIPYRNIFGPEPPKTLEEIQAQRARIAAVRAAADQAEAALQAHQYRVTEEELRRRVEAGRVAEQVLNAGPELITQASQYVLPSLGYSTSGQQADGADYPQSARIEEVQESPQWRPSSSTNGSSSSAHHGQNTSNPHLQSQSYSGLNTAPYNATTSTNGTQQPQYYTAYGYTPQNVMLHYGRGNNGAQPQYSGTAFYPINSTTDWRRAYGYNNDASNSSGQTSRPHPSPVDPPSSSATRYGNHSAAQQVNSSTSTAVPSTQTSATPVAIQRPASTLKGITRHSGEPQLVYSSNGRTSITDTGQSSSSSSTVDRFPPSRSAPELVPSEPRKLPQSSSSSLAGALTSNTRKDSSINSTSQDLLNHSKTPNGIVKPATSQAGLPASSIQLTPVNPQQSSTLSTPALNTTTRTATTLPDVAAASSSAAQSRPESLPSDTTQKQTVSQISQQTSNPTQSTVSQDKAMEPSSHRLRPPHISEILNPDQLKSVRYQVQYWARSLKPLAHYPVDKGSPVTVALNKDRIPFVIIPPSVTNKNAMALPLFDKLSPLPGPLDGIGKDPNPANTYFTSTTTTPPVPGASVPTPALPSTSALIPPRVPSVPSVPPGAQSSFQPRKPTQADMRRLAHDILRTLLAPQDSDRPTKRMKLAQTASTSTSNPNNVHPSPIDTPMRVDAQPPPPPPTQSNSQQPLLNGRSVFRPISTPINAPTQSESGPSTETARFRVDPQPATPDMHSTQHFIAPLPPQSTVTSYVVRPHAAAVAPNKDVEMEDATRIAGSLPPPAQLQDVAGGSGGSTTEASTPSIPSTTSVDSAPITLPKPSLPPTAQPAAPPPTPRQKTPTPTTSILVTPRPRKILDIAPSETRQPLTPRNKSASIADPSISHVAQNISPREIIDLTSPARPVSPVTYHDDPVLPPSPALSLQPDRHSAAPAETTSDGGKTPLFLPGTPSPSPPPTSHISTSPPPETRIFITSPNKPKESRAKIPKKRFYIEVPPFPDGLSKSDYGTKQTAERRQHPHRPIVLDSDQDSEYEQLDEEVCKDVDPASNGFANDAIEREAVHLSCSRMLERRCRYDSCNKLLNSAGKLVEHLSREHRPRPRSREFICRWQLCGKREFTARNFYYHLRSHATVPLRCAYQDCDMQFRTARQLARHHQSNHSEADELLPSNEPFRPKVIAAPSPIRQRVLPAYMLEPVQMTIIPPERHARLSRLVLKNISEPVQQTKRTYNAAEKRPLRSSTMADGEREDRARDDPSGPFSFLDGAAGNGHSTEISQPAKMRPYEDIDSEGATKLVEWEVELWGLSDGEGEQVTSPGASSSVTVAASAQGRTDDDEEMVHMMLVDTV